MIVRVTFLDMENKPFKMLFGTNYKLWKTHFEEFLYSYITWWDDKTILTCEIFDVIEVETSSSRWIQSGGLKWCSHETAQEQLEEELVIHKKQGGKRKKARQYDKIKFQRDFGNAELFCKNVLKDRLRHLSGSSVSDINKKLTRR